MHTAQTVFSFWGQNVEVVCWVSQNLRPTEVDAQVTLGPTSLSELQYGGRQGLLHPRSEAQFLSHPLSTLEVEAMRSTSVALC